MWRVAERVAWTIGLVALTGWVVLFLGGSVNARQELDRFAAARARGGTSDVNPDFHLWSPRAVQAWRAAAKERSRTPLGVLRIARLGLEAPVLEGTDDATLNRGVGHVEDTAQPGTSGNSGIAGHRDGFFRVLKDIVAGDALELETLAGVSTYRVERICIVQPEDVWVLDPTPSPSVTLVTCYPFYFVGAAPQRFIVRAVRSAMTQSPASVPGTQKPVNNVQQDR